MRQPASSDPRKQLVESGYDRIAERYLAWAGGIDDPGRARMLDLLLERLPPGGDVLDLGCGAGVPSTVRLAECHRVTGVDISQEQLRLPASGCRTPSWCMPTWRRSSSRMPASTASPASTRSATCRASS